MKDGLLSSNCQYSACFGKPLRKQFSIGLFAFYVVLFPCYFGEAEQYFVRIVTGERSESTSLGTMYEYNNYEERQYLR